MPKDMSVPAARKALRYVGKPGDPVGGGLPAADVSAEEAAGWYTAGQVQEALNRNQPPRRRMMRRKRVKPNGPNE
jgi:hypothetical protein